MSSSPSFSSRCHTSSSGSSEWATSSIAAWRAPTFDEHALAALLLPPLRRHLTRQPALELAAERDRGMANVGEGPARLDPHVDVDPAPPGGLGEPRVAELVQQPPRLRGDARGILVVGPRLGVEVEAQLVRMVHVLR